MKMLNRIAFITLFSSLLIATSVSGTFALNEIQQTAPIGIIKYRLIDLHTKKTISEQTLQISDIISANRHIIPSGSHEYFEDRYIKLYDDFVLGLNNYGYKKRDDIGGFGIWLNRTKKRVFSWEWYSQIDSNNFKKLQGQGALKVDFRQRDGYWEIDRMTFVGDQVLRAEKFGIIADLLKFFTGGPEDDWNCIILDGSYINWDLSAAGAVSSPIPSQQTPAVQHRSHMKFETIFLIFFGVCFLLTVLEYYWLWLMIRQPKKWATWVDRENDFWVRKGILSVAFAERIKSCEKGLLKILLGAGVFFNTCGLIYIGFFWARYLW